MGIRILEIQELKSGVAPQFLNAPIHNAFNNLMPEKEQNEIL
jgi:hypothetical protein